MRRRIVGRVLEGRELLQSEHRVISTSARQIAVRKSPPQRPLCERNSSLITGYEKPKPVLVSRDVLTKTRNARGSAQIGRRSYANTTRIDAEVEDNSSL